jgi:hypothetical protein
VGTLLLSVSVSMELSTTSPMRRAGFGMIGGAIDNVSVIDRCPRCDGPVDHGFVAGGNSMIWWSAKAHLFSLHAERLVHMRWLTANPRPAVRCSSCKLVIFQAE